MIIWFLLFSVVTSLISLCFLTFSIVFPKIIHRIAVGLLITINRKDVRRSQKMKLIALRCIEITYKMSDGVSRITVHVKLFSRWSFSMDVTGVTIMYILIMIVLTMERFLEIPLNIKCDLLCSYKRTKIVLTTAFIFCFLKFFSCLDFDLIYSRCYYLHI